MIARFLNLFAGRALWSGDYSVKYRPDVDGLRAIAVLSVMFYHFDVLPFASGFTGVDIFFVISGFLITGKLLEDHAAGRLSLLRFYEKRFKRILPAAMVLLLVVLVAGTVFLTPLELKRLAASGTYSAFGLANFYFLWNTGYFAPAAIQQPLLHMWSLGVEEQFYLFWPVLLLLTLSPEGGQRRLFWLLVIVCSISFAMSVYWVEANQNVAFYMLHTRAWELGLGALICFFSPISNQKYSELTDMLGIILIGASVTLLDRATFPGVYALLPCIGAALILWPKNRPTVVSFGLATRFSVFFGLISYSLYLWHWPILVFFRHWNNKFAPSAMESVMLMLIAIAISYLSWRFIEPLRFVKASRPSVLAGGIIAMSLVAVLMIGVAVTDGLPSRLPESAVRFASADLRTRAATRGASQSYKNLKCSIRKSSNDLPACLSRRSGNPRVLVIGDSYASQYRSALLANFPNADFTFVTNYGCRPVIHSRGREICVNLMREAFGAYIPSGQFDAIILAARWTSGQYDGIRDTVHAVAEHTKTIYVVGPPIEYRLDLPELLMRDYLPRRSIPSTELTLYTRAARIENLIRESLSGTKAEYLSVLDILCQSRDSCTQLTPDGTPMQYDYGHFTVEGNEYVVRQLRNRGLLATFR